MYRNYDGAGAGFGDVAVRAQSTDQDQLAIYGAERTADGALTLVVVNKTGSALTSTVALTGFAAAPSARMYHYGAANPGAIVHDADVAVTGNALAVTFPASSITLLAVGRATGASATPARTATATTTHTPSPSATPTRTATRTPTRTPTPSATATPTASPSATSTHTPSGSRTATPVATATRTTTPTPVASATPGGAPVLVHGKQHVVKDRPGLPSRRTIAFASDDDAVDPTASAIDPSADGAVLQLYNAAGTGESMCIVLPGTGWSASGTTRPSWRYRDALFAAGPCSAATITHGRLKVKCAAKAQPIAYALDEPSQGAMAVRFGTGPTTWCARFGGRVQRDSGTDPPIAGGRGQFAAVDAVAPSTCPPAPVACP